MNGLPGAYLEQEGYEILEYNYRCKTGEIDIIAREAGYLVFCEVKYRSSDKKGHPAEAVNQPNREPFPKVHFAIWRSTELMRYHADSMW